VGEQLLGLLHQAEALLVRLDPGVEPVGLFQEGLHPGEVGALQRRGAGGQVALLDPGGLLEARLGLLALLLQGHVGAELGHGYGAHGMVTP
jgi:hypothetical protein